MNSLTLNNNITQLRCKVLISGFQYEAMINNQWQPVTHQFAEIVWNNYRTKRRSLVKINPLSYIVKALAKSSAEISLSEFEHERRRSYCGFFVRNTLVLLLNYDLSNEAEKLAGIVCGQSANVTLIIYSMVGWVGAPQGAPGSCSPVRLTSFSSPPIRLASVVVSFINLNTRAVFMTTIPNEIVSNKTISISQIDVINKKLLQAEAILHLLTLNSTAEVQINDNLVCNILWATSDLVADARQFLHNDKSKEVIG